MYSRSLATEVVVVTTNEPDAYRIAGNFRGVQIFAFFEDAPLYAKLKYRPSSTSKTAARELAAPNCVTHANSNEMDAKLAS